jgi:hypothetical protein
MERVWITNAEEDGFKMWAIQLDWKTGKLLKKFWFLKTKNPSFATQ